MTCHQSPGALAPWPRAPDSRLPRWKRQHRVDSRRCHLGVAGVLPRRVESGRGYSPCERVLGDPSRVCWAATSWGDVRSAARPGAGAPARAVRCGCAPRPAAGGAVERRCSARARAAQARRVQPPQAPLRGARGFHCPPGAQGATVLGKRAMVTSREGLQRNQPALPCTHGAHWLHGLPPCARCSLCWCWVTIRKNRSFFPSLSLPRSAAGERRRRRRRRASSFISHILVIVLALVRSIGSPVLLQTCTPPRLTDDSPTRRT